MGKKFATAQLQIGLFVAPHKNFLRIDSIYRSITQLKRYLSSFLWGGWFAAALEQIFRACMETPVRACASYPSIATCEDEHHWHWAGIHTNLRTQRLAWNAERSVGWLPANKVGMDGFFYYFLCVFFFCKIELVPVKFMYDSSAITTF
jgi:hypothetical protein